VSARDGQRRGATSTCRTRSTSPGAWVSQPSASRRFGWPRRRERRNGRRLARGDGSKQMIACGEEFERRLLAGRRLPVHERRQRPARDPQGDAPPLSLRVPAPATSASPPTASWLPAIASSATRPARWERGGDRTARSRTPWLAERHVHTQETLPLVLGALPLPAAAATTRCWPAARTACDLRPRLAALLHRRVCAPARCPAGMVRRGVHGRRRRHSCGAAPPVRHSPSSGSSRSRRKVSSGAPRDTPATASHSILGIWPLFGASHP